MVQMCGELTLEGRRCSRRPREGREYCWQHPRKENVEHLSFAEETLRCGAALKAGKYCANPAAFNGKRCEQHLDTSEIKFRELSKEADAGSSASQNDVGAMYLFGEGCTPNIEKAEELFAEAARAGQPEAHTNIGLIHLRDEGEPAMNRAFSRFKKAAEQGEPDAQYNLACFYDALSDDLIERWEFPRALMGEVLAFDSNKSSTAHEAPSKNSRDMAIYWYRKSADNGVPLASYRLSVLLTESDGAETYLKQASKQFIAEGCRFADGNGRIQDLFKAYKYFLMAEELGAETRKEREPLDTLLNDIDIINAETEALEKLSQLSKY